MSALGASGVLIDGTGHFLAPRVARQAEEVVTTEAETITTTAGKPSDETTEHPQQQQYCSDGTPAEFRAFLFSLKK